MANQVAWKTRLTVVVLMSSIPAWPNQLVTTTPARPPDIAAELMVLRPPYSDGVDDLWANVGRFVRPYSEGGTGAPPLDAPLGVLADHDWGSTFRDDQAKPTDPLRMRLLEACEAYPWKAADLVRWVPQTPEAYARIKALLEKTPEDKFEHNSKELVVAYVSRNSGYFRPRLIAAAKSVREGPGWINNADDLRALARLDWKQAAAILRSYVAFHNPRAAALALSLQYRHAVELSSTDAVALRRQLRGIAEEKTAKGYARNFAIEALMSSDWEGRDEWFLSLLGDPSLDDLSDGVSIFSPLEEPVHRDPSKWIPKIAPLVNSSDSNVRRSAIYILVSFQATESRPDAALPLLPWLFDPHWVHVGDSGHDRRNLIYSLSKMREPESIPGLIHVLENPTEDDVWEIDYAAEAVGQFHDSRIIPVLRKLIQQAIRFEERQAVARVLLASGEVTLDDKIQAIEAFLRQVKSRAVREQLGRAAILDEEDISIAGKVVLGLTVLEVQGDNETLREAMRKRSSVVRGFDPEIANQFDSVLSVLPDPKRDRQLIDRIRDGTADLEMVRAALERGQWLRLSVPHELRKVADGQGAPAGIAAVLLGDEIREFEILDGHDGNAQRALLASALMAGGAWLDEQQVLKLMDSADLELGKAAAKYYEMTHRL